MKKISYSKILPEPDKNLYSCLTIIILFLFVYEILYFQSVLPSRSEHTKKDKIWIYVLETISFINYLIIIIIYISFINYLINFIRK